jgi:hypothetical protein
VLCTMRQAVTAMQKNNHALVSRTWIIPWSSPLVGVKDSPPRTKTLPPMEAMACPERPLGAGPMFWNMYHRWSVRNKLKVTHTIYTSRSRTRHLECCQIVKVLSVYTPPAKYVDDVVDHSGCVTFSRGGNKTDTLELSPHPCISIIGPCIIVMVLTIRSSEAVQT